MTDQEKAQRMYDALKDIAKAQTVTQVRREGERMGLYSDEALGMAYENVVEHARQCIHGMRRPKS